MAVVAFWHSRFHGVDDNDQDGGESGVRGPLALESFRSLVMAMALAAVVRVALWRQSGL